MIGQEGPRDESPTLLAWKPEGCESNTISWWVRWLSRARARTECAPSGDPCDQMTRGTQSIRLESAWLTDRMVGWLDSWMAVGSEGRARRPDGVTLRACEAVRR